MYLRQASVDKSLIVVGCEDEDGGMLPSDVIFEKIKTIIDERI
jgi:hypothetical protein